MFDWMRLAKCIEVIEKRNLARMLGKIRCEEGRENIVADRLKFVVECRGFEESRADETACREFGLPPYSCVKGVLTIYVGVTLNDVTSLLMSRLFRSAVKLSDSIRCWSSIGSPY